MNHSITPRYEPKQPEPVHPPMIYIKESLKWEYKQIARDLKKEGPLNEAELNALGAEGWEWPALPNNRLSHIFTSSV